MVWCSQVPSRRRRAAHPPALPCPDPSSLLHQQEAFDKARAEDKPIFLSVGYSTCHWCHVMERESFESEEIAGGLMRVQETECERVRACVRAHANTEGLLPC